MKVTATILGILGVVFASAVSEVRADQIGDLCAILTTTRNNEAAINRQIANERNPLKQNSLQQQLRQVAQQREASLYNFLNVTHRHFANFTGVVSSFDAMQYVT